MSRLERFFERLVERPSARLFRTHLRPVQVLRRIERTMESDRGTPGVPSLVPDRYLVRLHPADLATLGSLDGVAADLASGALRFARAHGYALRERPRVTLHADPAMRPGEVDVSGSFSPVATPVGDPDVAEGGTRVFEVPVVRAPRIRLEVREPNRPTRRVAVTGEPIEIGRAADCGLVLADTRVSRHHARLRGRDGLLVLTDLGSTNGTYVNEQRVREVVLGAGDRIQLGETRLVVEAGSADPADA